MDISLDNAPKHNITRYCTDSIDVDNIPYTQSIILTPEKIIVQPDLNDFNQMDIDNLEPIVKLNPEIVIIGTGNKQHFPSPSISLFFGQKKIGLEVMKTAAACRTYNILAAEGRRVVALLLIA